MSLSYWLWIEPYVHVSIKKNRALLYNTLSGKKLEFGHRSIIRMIKAMMKKENLLVIEVRKKEFEKPCINEFIAAIKDHFMGDLADVNASVAKPIQLMPMISNHADVRRAKKSIYKPGKSIMTYLYELTIYINGGAGVNHDNIYKQFLFPRPGTEGRTKELAVHRIDPLLTELKGSGLYSLNVIGGNILVYSEFEKLLTCLESYPLLKTFHIYYTDAADYLDRVHRINGEKAKIEFSVTFPVNLKKFETIVHYIKAKENMSVLFAIANENELETCEQLISRYNPVNFQIKPYYNGTNIDFFRNVVYIDSDHIRESTPSQKEIFQRMAMNSNDFGKLTIMTNGDIYANLNHPRLGNINKNSISDVIYKELFKGKSWLSIRGQKRPCNGCLYNVLCPPLSNYEYVIGGNNLCHQVQK